MPMIENVSFHPQRFTQKGGKRIEIAPGDSAPVDIDKDNIHVRAKIRAGLIVFGGGKRQGKTAAQSTGSAAPARTRKRKTTKTTPAAKPVTGTDPAE